MGNAEYMGIGVSHLQNLLLQALPNNLQGAKAKMKATLMCSVCVLSLVVMAVSSTPLTPKERFLGQLLGGLNGDQTTPPPNPTQPSLGLIQFLLNLLLPTTTTTTTTTTPPAETATKCGGLFGGGLIC